MGLWIKRTGRMYQFRMSDVDEFERILALREWRSDIERRRYERRRDWIDPIQGTVRQFRRKNIRRENDI